jgi:hypothetical protein
MPMTARCGGAALCHRATTVRQLPHMRQVVVFVSVRTIKRHHHLGRHTRQVGSCWLCGSHRACAAAAACETRGNPDRGTPSSAFHTTSQRPACVALAIHTVSLFHSVALEASVQQSGLPRVVVHALAFSSTPSHANAAEFSSTPSHAAAAARDLCSPHHSPRVRQLSPANDLHALLWRSTQSASFIVFRWKCRCNCLDCHELSSTPLRFRPHPRMPMQLSFLPQ